MKSKTYYHVVFVLEDGTENGIGGSCNRATAEQMANEIERACGERPTIRREKLYF